MIITSHQPNYLPYLGFIEKISRADVYVIADTYQYSHGGESFQNRNRIRNYTGPLWLTIPIQHAGKFQRICDVMIQNQSNWAINHWKSICCAYSKAPYFNSYKDFFEKTYSQKWDKLANLNEHIIRYLLKEFKISVDIVKTSELSLNKDGDGTDKMIKTCQVLGAETFIAGKKGVEYMDFEKIKCAGIHPFFQDFKHPVYPQQYPHLGFIPNLSCIDMLFNVGENSMKMIREANPFESIKTVEQMIFEHNAVS